MCFAPFILKVYTFSLLIKKAAFCVSCSLISQQLHWLFLLDNSIQKTTKIADSLAYRTTTQVAAKIYQKAHNFFFSTSIPLTEYFSNTAMYIDVFIIGRQESYYFSLVRWNVRIITRVKDSEFFILF